MKLNPTLSSLALGVLASTTFGGIGSLPVTESFDTGAENWRTVDGVTDADWFATGGADGGGYISTTVDVPEFIPPFGVLGFRGQDEYNSSNNAFVGDWLAAGVTQFSFSVRHDALAPLQFFARIAAPDNTNGAVLLDFGVVTSGEWTELTFDISAFNPGIVFEGSDFNTTFSNVGHIQIGAVPDDALANTSFTFDIDEISIVPAPGALALFAPAACIMRRRRRG